MEGKESKKKRKVERIREKSSRIFNQFEFICALFLLSRNEIYLYCSFISLNPKDIKQKKALCDINTILIDGIKSAEQKDTQQRSCISGAIVLCCVRCALTRCALLTPYLIFYYYCKINRH